MPGLLRQVRVRMLHVTNHEDCRSRQHRGPSLYLQLEAGIRSAALRHSCHILHVPKPLLT